MEIRHETGGRVFFEGLWGSHILFTKGGGFTYFVEFSPLLGEDEPILTNIFQLWVKPPSSVMLPDVHVG